MAIYMNGWATVEVVDAKYGEEGGLYIKVRRTSAYHDGSGAETIGELAWEGSFEHCAYFRADNGFGEIEDAAKPFLKERGVA